MASNIVSPGVYVIEKDISEYTPPISTSVVGLVGFADRGPSGVATLITSPHQLVQTFGSPREAITGQALEAAVEILESTDSLYFVRAADSNAAAASGVLQFGGCPALVVSGPIAADDGFAGAVGYGDWGVDRDLYLSIQVVDNNGVSAFPEARKYDLPAGTLTATDPSAFGQLALRKIIGGGEVDDAKVGIQFGVSGDGSPDTSAFLVGSFAGSNAYIEASAYSDSDRTTGLKVFKVIDCCGMSVGAGGGEDTGNGYSYRAKTYGTTFLAEDPDANQTTGVASSLGYVVKTLHTGAGYNAGTIPTGGTSGVQAETKALGGDRFQVNIVNDGVVAETFKQTLVSGTDFMESVLNSTVLDPKSEHVYAYLTSGISGNVFHADYVASGMGQFVNSVSAVGGGLDGGLVFTGTYGRAVKGTWVSGDGVKAGGGETQVAPRFVKLLQQKVDLANGDSGIPSTDATINTAIIGTTQADGKKTGIEALDNEALNISIVAIPGITQEASQNALVTKAEATQDFIAVLSPPYGVGTVQNAIDWTNGLATSRGSALNSSYAAVYWPWLKVFDVFEGKNRWMDPAIYGVKAMCDTDGKAETWFAPAGFQRGRLTKATEAEVTLNKGERDSMYSGGNVINPIVKFPQRGLTIFGQRTTQRAATALDRINVRRLMIFLKKVIFAATQTFVFEPNDEFTWARVEAAVNPLVSDIKSRRGITDFRVVCDDTTNTAVRVDRNELWCKVLIKPTKAAEMIVFEVNLTNQAAKMGNL